MKWACVVMVILNLLLLVVAGIRVLMLPPPGPLPPRPVVEVKVSAPPVATRGAGSPRATAAEASAPAPEGDTPAPAPEGTAKKDEIPGMENAVGVTSHPTYEYDSKEAEGAQQRGMDDAKEKMRRKFGSK